MNPDTFQTDARNLNIKARSTKDGMIYKAEIEITQEDFDNLSARELTGSCFNLTWEVTAQGEKKQKGGSLAQSAAQICGYPTFTSYIKTKSWNGSTAEYVRTYCGIKSRSELDHNKEAAKKFNKIMNEYESWIMGTP